MHAISFLRDHDDGIVEMCSDVLRSRDSQEDGRNEPKWAGAILIDRDWWVTHTSVKTANRDSRPSGFRRRLTQYAYT